MKVCLISHLPSALYWVQQKMYFTANGYNSCNLIIILVVTLIFYIKLLYLSKQSARILNEVKKMERIKAISRNVILAATNTICWIPSSLFFLISVFVAEFPVLVLYWIKLVVLPINAIMNPIIFNLSNIKNDLNKIKGHIKF